MELRDLDQYKHLPSAEFDARLGALLKAEHEKRRAAAPKLVKVPAPKKASGK